MWKLIMCLIAPIVEWGTVILEKFKRQFFQVKFSRGSMETIQSSHARGV